VMGMEARRILLLSERLQRVLEEAEAEADRIIAEAKRRADRIIAEARGKAEERRIRAERGEGIEHFIAEAEAEAEREAGRILKEYEEKASKLREIQEERFEEAVSLILREVLPR